MNPAYRHLEEPVKIGDFTLGQIAGFLVAAMLAMLWGFVISPLPPIWSLFTAIYIGGLPAMAVLFASTTDFDAFRMVKAYVLFQRRPGRFVPGAGRLEDRGYVVKKPPVEKHRPVNTKTDEILIGEALWGD
ncbi:MAG TPA: hypothetical protein P5138_11690 [Solirubrobacterales bacterium]|nr:hypothetical protein [Solirubrobacterales bacterium]HNH87595.1 hypothetical protein [Solirubrobacterales bacterium]HRV61285.1 hypothetical protein [Solirubrobacterales bacterium]